MPLKLPGEEAGASCVDGRKRVKHKTKGPKKGPGPKSLILVRFNHSILGSRFEPEDLGDEHPVFCP